MRISVLRAGRTRKTRLTHRLLRQSGRVRVDRYFGSSPTFVFGRPLRVSRGNRIALTVPTWTPSLALGLGRVELVALLAPQGLVLQREPARHAAVRRAASATTAAPTSRPG